MRSVQKSYNKHFLIQYSVLFVIITIVLSGVFFYEHKTFVWLDDGISNNIVELGSSQYVLKRLLLGTTDYINYSLIENNAMMRFFYWGFRDIFASFSSVNGKVAVYISLYIIQVYISGVSFGAYCLFHKLPHRSALLGAMIYAFNGYTVYLMKQPVFGFTTVLLPLAYLGIDKIILKKSGIGFSITIAILALCNVTYVWPFTILLAVYITGRLIMNFNGGRLVEFARYFVSRLIIIIKWWIYGVLLAGIMVIPVLTLIAKSSRMDTTISTNSLLWYGKSSFLNFWANEIFEPTSNLTIGLPIIMIIVVIVGFFTFKKDKEVAFSLTFFILSIIGYLVPLWGLIVRAFADINNRVWMYALVFFAAYLAAGVFSKFQNKFDKKIGVVSAIVLFTFMVYFLQHRKFVGENGLPLEVFFVIGLLFILGISYFVGDKQRGNLWYCGVCVNVIIFMTISVHLLLPSYLDNNVSLDEYYGKFVDSAAMDMSDTDYYRIEKYKDTGEYNLNLPQWYGYNGLSVFHSVLPNEICEYMIRTENAGFVMNNKISGFDGRSNAELLGAVKYFLVPSDSGEYVPYGYELYKGQAGYNHDTDIYVNAFSLPLGFTYKTDQFLTESTVEELDGLTQSELMLQFPIIDTDDVADFEISDVDSIKRLPFEIISFDGGTIDDQIFKTVKKNGQLTINVQGLPNSELYVRLMGIEPRGASNRFTVFCNNVEKEVRMFSSKDFHKINRGAVFVNLGYHELQDDRNITIAYYNAGEYNISDIEVYSLSMDHFDERANELKDESLTIDNITTSEVTGSVTLSNDKWICFSLPYNAGWDLYVDGNKISYVKMNYVYFGTLLKEGTHQIRLVYHVPGLFAGCLCSIAGIILFIGNIVYDQKRREIYADYYSNDR